MKILHLSDLHFGTRANATNWYSQIADDLINELNCNAVDILVLSGDIGNRATPGEYAAARQFVKSLTAEFKIDRRDIVLIPGNHDVNWSAARKAYRPVRRENYKGALDEAGRLDPGVAIDGQDYIEVVNEAKCKAKFNNFSDFYKDIIGYEYPSDYSQQALIYDFPDRGLLFLGLNSAWQLDHHYTARAGIHPEAVSNAVTRIRQAGDEYANRIKFAVWHHPLNSQGEDRITDQSFLQRLALNGFSFGMHGHIHMSEYSSFKYDMTAGGRRLDIIAAGTFGAPIHEWVPGYPLQYNLITLAQSALVVETRCRREINGAWKPDAMWSTGPGRDPSSKYELPLPTRRTTTGASDPATTGAPAIDPATFVPPCVIDPPRRDPAGPPGRPDEAGAEVGRGLASGDPAPQTPASKRVLIVAANPRDTSPLRLTQEVREISNVLRHSTGLKFHVEVLWAVRIADLRRALLEVEPDIIHFSGHGTGERGIALEDDDGNHTFVSPASLAELFRLFSDSTECALQCVFMNACYSNIQADAMLPFAGYVIGVGEAIGDDAAIEFSRGFYEALAFGRDYQRAYEFGCSAVRTANFPGSAIPVIQKNPAPRAAAGGRGKSPPGRRSTPSRTILYFAANPMDTPRFRWDEEFREISDVSRPARIRGEILLEPRWGVRFEDIYLAQHELRADILHFSAHSSDAGLILEDDKGMSQVIEKDELTELLSSINQMYNCVFVNNHVSDEFAAALLHTSDSVIATAGPCADRSLILFAKGFYRAMAIGRSVDDAFRDGKLALRVGGGRDNKDFEKYKFFK